MEVRNVVAVGAMVITSLAVFGCSKSGDTQVGGIPATETSNEDHSHEGWWCSEHGVPEEICALCSTKIAADFKAKGDWCEEHDRPDSQCFLCHPEKEGEFAALYVAKFGEQPPKPAADRVGHETE
jgi:cobalt-zinc-cadmium efflux system membrane fusion protein